MSEITSIYEPAPVPDGRVEINGKMYMQDGKGGFKPIETIKPQHLLEDEVVRKQFGYALALEAQIGRFKAHVHEDLAEFDGLLAQNYGATKGGAKGNRTYSTVDGLMQVEVRIQDQISFGAEMQVAKSLMDECLNEWSADSRAELRSLVTRAFETDKLGKINRFAVFALLQVESEDERFRAAQQAIRDAMRVTGTKPYVRFRRKATMDAAWETVSIDLAKV